VHAIIDDSAPHILTELAARVHAAIDPERRVHLVLENDANEARYLGPGQYAAQWNDDIHHALHVLATGEADGYYADYADAPARHLGRCLTEGFAYQGEPSPIATARRGASRARSCRRRPSWSFLQNHDQIGNRAFGERIGQLAPAPAPCARRRRSTCWRRPSRCCSWARSSARRRRSCFSATSAASCARR
jgi:maltooligosyltrehalose trehalohydrolase